MKLVDELQAHFLEVFWPLSRPVAEHEVEQPGVVDDLMSQLLKCKVSVPPFVPVKAVLVWYTLQVSPYFA